MGLFGPSKPKITPNDFVKDVLDKIFSTHFIEAETEGFTRLSNEFSVLQSVGLDKYLNERQNVIYNLFKIAWDRTIPYSIFIACGMIVSDDPRVKAMNTRIYSRSLSRAQEVRMDTFGFISRIFISQILSQAPETIDANYSKLHAIYKADFTKHYISFETLIKQYKFIK